MVLQRHKSCGIKLRPNKCDLFKREVCYVGHVLSQEGYRMNPTEITAIQALKKRKPKRVREVRSLVSFLGYYRSFIPLYDKLSYPKTEKKETKMS